MSWTDEDRRAKAWGGGSAGDEYVPLVAAIDEEARNQAQQAKSEAEAAMAAPYQPFTSRAQAEVTVIDGSVQQINVAGLAYVRDENGTALTTADGGSWSPLGEVTPQHFGALGDLEYELQQIRGSGGVLTDAYGLVRTDGTNDRSAIVAADLYAALMDQPLVFPPGRYFIDGTVRPTTLWLSEDDFGAVLWLNYNEDETGRSTSGLEFFKSDTGLGVSGNHGFHLIGQYSRTTPKEGGNGQLGTVWRINDYYMPNEQPVLVGMHIRAKVVRAALQRNEGGTITQRSIPSFQGAVMAGVEHSNFEIGVWGRTNVSSTGPLLVHWGCLYDTESLNDTLGPNKSLARIIETYHACWIKITFITPLDNRDGHNFLQPFDLASTGPVDVYGVDCINVGGGATGVNFGGALGSISCGDICDAYAIPRHKEVLWKGINIYSPKASGVNSALGSEQLYIKGMGTAKYPGDVEPGTGLLIQRQLRAEISVYNPQCSYTEDAVPGDQRTAFIDTVFGSVTVQNLTSFGAHRAIEIEDTWGRVLVDGVSGDGATLVNFAGSVDLLDQRMDRHNSQNAGDSSNYAFGWGSPNSRAVEISGSLTSIGTVAGDLTISDNIIPLAAPSSAPVPTGVKLRIGNQVVQSTRMHRAGAVQLSVTPLSAPILTGATVTADRRSKVGRMELATRSSFHALDVNGSDVSDLDMTRMSYAGRNAVRLRGDSVVTVNGGGLPIMGRAGGDMRTFRAEGTSRVNLNGIHILDNPAITTHVALIGSESSLSVRDCIMENPATIVAYGQRGQVSWVGNRKTDGSRAVWGGYEATWTPSLLIGGVDTGITYASQTGSYVLQEDGMVTVRFDFTLTSKGLETGNLTIGGVPFDIESATAFPLIMHNSSLTDGAPVLTASGSVFTMARQTTTGVAILDETQITDSTRFRGSLTYRTTL